MVLKLKLRKVGNSVGLVLPKEALAHLKADEGDTLVFSESPDGGYRLTPNNDPIAQRYRNALRELAK